MRRGRLNVKKPLYFYAIMISLTCLLTLAALEGGAQFIESTTKSTGSFPHLARYFNMGLILDDYEQASKKYLWHWELKPNYASKANNSPSRAPDGYPIFDAVTINSDGFRGESFQNIEPARRIVTIGDSVVFGIHSTDIASVLATELSSEMQSVEVLNAGVEGYSSRNALLQVYEKVKSGTDAAVILVGWNDIFGEGYLPNSPLRHFALARAMQKTIRFIEAPTKNARHARAVRLMHRPLRPACSSEDVTAARSYAPGARENIDEMIEILKSRGVSVFLLTLPGLVIGCEKISKAAQRLVHLPEFTTNPYVLSEMAGQYNEMIRSFDDYDGVKVIDAATWSVNAFSPREAFFSDSVHLTRKGLILLGKYIASNLDLRDRHGSIKSN